METFVPKGHLNGMVMPDYIENFSTLRIEARYLYAVLCDFAQDQDHCWPSQTTLVGRLRCSVGSLKKYLRQLEAEKLILIEHTPRGCKYYLLRPANIHIDGSNSDGGGPSDSAAAPSKSASKGSNPDGKSLSDSANAPSKFASNVFNKKKEYYTPPTPSFAPAARVVSSSLPKEISRVAVASPKRQPRQDQSQAEEAFAQVWAAYPRPPRFVSRDKAWQAWWKLWRQGALPELETVLSAIKLNAKHNPAWNPGNENGRYIPNLENWLAGKRWQDDIPCPSQALSTPSDHSRHMVQQAQSVLRSLNGLKSNPAPTPSPDVADFERLAAQFGGIDEKKRPMAMGLFRLVKAKGLQVQPQAGDFITVLKHAAAGAL